MANVNQFRFLADSHYQQDKKNQVDAFKRMYANFDLERPNIKLLKEVGLGAMEASDYLFDAVKNYKDGVVYPDNNFARGLKFIAQMICTDVDHPDLQHQPGGF